jgi:hypothetical protein
MPQFEPGRLDFVGPDSVVDALTFGSNLVGVGEPVNRRLRAAVAYVAQVQRLCSVQRDRTEFASEVVLNIAKAVSVLFGSIDELRAYAVRRFLEVLDIHTFFAPPVMPVVIRFKSS